MECIYDITEMADQMVIREADPELIRVVQNLADMLSFDLIPFKEVIKVKYQRYLSENERLFWILYEKEELWT